MTLETLIKERGPIKKIGVVGMGYVGIPAAALFADSPKFEHVYGFQRDSPSSGYKIAMLNRGESPLKGEEPGLEEILKKVVAAGKFTCTSDFPKIAEMDAVTLSIQTPFQEQGRPRPRFLGFGRGHPERGPQSAARDAGRARIHDHAGDDHRPGPRDARSGVRPYRRSGLCACPCARACDGRTAIRNIREHDRIVGGIDPVSTARATELYAPVLTLGKVIPMTATAAEVTKTAENTFRDLQIAAVNELALYCEAMGSMSMMCGRASTASKVRGSPGPCSGPVPGSAGTA